MVTAGKIILRFLAKTETGVSPSSVRMVCCVCGFVVLWSEQVVTGCMIFSWFLAGTEPGVAPSWCFLVSFMLVVFCACGFCGYGLGAAGKRRRKEGKRKMYICIAKILYYELQLEFNLKDRRGGVS